MNHDELGSQLRSWLPTRAKRHREQTFSRSLSSQKGASARGSQPWGSFEKKTLNPGVSSTATPADVGLSFERVSISSGTRLLDGFLVRAPTTCPGPTAAILLFHGRNEATPDWVGVQKLLHDHCISSLVFDYTGHGRSSPGGSISHLNQDALAATEFFTARFAQTQRRCLVSHSMGAGPLLFAATAQATKVDCLVVASPFASLKSEAILGGLPKPIALVMSDPWDNARAVSQVRAPLLWIHSQDDKIIPINSGRQVFQAARAPKFAVTVRGFDHNAIQRQRPAEIWDPIIRFIRAGAL